MNLEGQLGLLARPLHYPVEAVPAKRGTTTFRCEHECRFRLLLLLQLPQRPQLVTANAETPYHDKNFTKDKTIILYCASGGRSALGGKVLKDMGYAQVYNLGAFKDWADSGGPVDKPIEPDM